MKQPLAASALDQPFRTARTYPSWPERPVTDEQIGEGYNLLKWGPTSMNCLPGAYLILAARALGLDVGPMSGFNNEQVDAEFFPNGRFRSNFLVNLGYGEKSAWHARGPRMTFQEAAELL
jgi:nitroreductase